MINNDYICNGCLKKALSNARKITMEGLSDKQKSKYIRRIFRWLKTGLQFVDIERRQIIINIIMAGILKQYEAKE